MQSSLSEAEKWSKTIFVLFFDRFWNLIQNDPMRDTKLQRSLKIIAEF